MKRGGQGPLQVQVFRGSQVESQHFADAVVVDSDGKVVEKYGDSQCLVFPRSAIKMIQALPLIESGAAELLNLPESYLALACASHLGETLHTDAVSQWLGKMGLSAGALECGAHEPFDEQTRRAMIGHQQVPSAIHNNCSGKHCGMISTALQMKVDPKGYSHYDHPIQAHLRQVLSELGGIDYHRAPWGVDGCGIPTYAIPLQNIALSMSVLLPEARSVFGEVPKSRKESAKKILQAIQKYPLMISGSEGLCSAVVRESFGQVIAKTGAEGVYTALLLQKGLSISLKVRDGASRASELAILHLAQKHGGIGQEQMSKLAPFTEAVLKNWAGKVVGKIELASTAKMLDS